MLDRYILAILAANTVFWAVLTGFVVNAGSLSLAMFTTTLAALTGFATAGYYVFSREWRDL